MPDATSFFIVVSALQVVLVGLAAWSLSTTVKLLDRVSRLETIMQSHVSEQIKDTKRRVQSIERQIHDH